MDCNGSPIFLLLRWFKPEHQAHEASHVKPQHGNSMIWCSGALVELSLLSSWKAESYFNFHSHLSSPITNPQNGLPIFLQNGCASHWYMILFSYKGDVGCFCRHFKTRRLDEVGHLILTLFVPILFAWHSRLQRKCLEPATKWKGAITSTSISMIPWHYDFVVGSRNLRCNLGCQATWVCWRGLWWLPWQ